MEREDERLLEDLPGQYEVNADVHQGRDPQPHVRDPLSNGTVEQELLRRVKPPFLHGQQTHIPNCVLIKN
jgi:hypothetical protein